MVAMANDPKLSKQDLFTCICCRIKLDSSLLQRAHFKTEWHSYNLKRKVCNLASIDQESFDLIHSSVPEKAKGHDKQSVVEPGSPSKVEDQDDESDWDEVDEDEEEWDEDEANEMLSRVIQSDTCLFCAKKSTNIEKNIKHMNLIHGFFIPEEKYMIDLEGMMEYVGFKVGAGTTCIWCQKQFTTLKGVRNHMIIKDHCKIMFDQDKATDEFKEFYDYSTQDKFEMKPIKDLVIVKKRRHDNDRSLVKSKLGGDSSRSLIRSNNHPVLSPCQIRSRKKFDSFRAKIALRISYGNNQTMRGRLRQQNPI